MRNLSEQDHQAVIWFLVAKGWQLASSAAKGLCLNSRYMSGILLFYHSN
jgi:hypothetical protein